MTNPSDLEQQRDALLAELELAHRIIANALNSSTVTVKRNWQKLNDQSRINSEGLTRANEREALILKIKANK